MKLVTFIVLTSIATSYGVPDKELYEKLINLDFYTDTTNIPRRESPMDKMKCVSGSCEYAPSYITCCKYTGKGSWMYVSSDINQNYTIRGVNIICEGYDFDNDPVISIGSCRLEYNIERKSDAFDLFLGFGTLFIVFAIVLCCCGNSQQYPNCRLC